MPTGSWGFERFLWNHTKTIVSDSISNGFGMPFHFQFSRPAWSLDAQIQAIWLRFKKIIWKPLFLIVFQMVLECLFISNFQDLEKSMKTTIKPIFLRKTKENIRKTNTLKAQTEKSQRKPKQNQYLFEKTKGNLRKTNTLKAQT